MPWLVGGVLLLNGFFALAYLALGDGALHGGEVLGLAIRSCARSASASRSSRRATPVPCTPSEPRPTGSSVFESFFGPFMLVATAGLLIARLTRPRMRLRFSESAVVAPYEGGRGLMFRFVNTQPSELSDVQVRVSLALFEAVDGKRERNFYPLALERDSVDLFTLHWTVVHPINADSPLRGTTPDKLRDAQAEILILVNAHEENFSTRVTARASYWWDEFRWDAKFANIFASSPDGAIAIARRRPARPSSNDVRPRRSSRHRHTIESAPAARTQSRRLPAAATLTASRSSSCSS